MKITRQVIDRDTGATQQEEKILTVDVKPGWKAGTKITFAKEGDQVPGQTPADIVFVIQEKPHEYFSRDGDDLVYRAKISLRQALTGFDLSVPTLDGRSAKLSVREPIEPGTTRIIPFEGMPISKQPDNRGNMRVVFDVAFPTQLSEEQKQKLKEALPRGS